MHKFFFCCVTFSLLVSGCKKTPQPVVVETPVDHQVELSLARTTDYSAAIYDDLTAEVRIEASLVVSGTGQRETIWDSVINVPVVRDYRGVNDPLIIQKRFRNPLPSQKRVHISQNVRYFKRGVIQWQTASVDPINEFGTIKKVVVHL